MGSSDYRSNSGSNRSSGVSPDAAPFTPKRDNNSGPLRSTGKGHRGHVRFGGGVKDEDSSSTGGGSMGLTDCAYYDEANGANGWRRTRCGKAPAVMRNGVYWCARHNPTKAADAERVKRRNTMTLEKVQKHTLYESLPGGDKVAEELLRSQGALRALLYDKDSAKARARAEAVLLPEGGNDTE